MATDCFWLCPIALLAQSVPYEPDSALLFACLAAALSEKHDVCTMMLRNDEIKRALVHLADADGPDGDADGALDGAGRELTGRSALRRARSSADGGAADGAGGARPWWEAASPAQLEVAYARLALHRLSLSAETLGAAEMTEEERADLAEPFVAIYREHDAPPLPPRPPLTAFAPPPAEQLALSLVSVGSCAVGGVVWGTLAGAVASARARRPVWRSAVLAAAGAALFEGLMQAKLAVLARWRVMGVPGASPSAPPPYATLRTLALTSSVDLGLSCAVLYALVQPGRAPLTFGGWVLGRAISLSQEATFDVIEYDE